MVSVSRKFWVMSLTAFHAKARHFPPILTADVAVDSTGICPCEQDTITFSWKRKIGKIKSAITLFSVTIYEYNTLI